MSDTIAATAKQKSTKRSVKSKAKYTREYLDSLTSKEVVKIYRAEIPVVTERKLDPNNARKGDMIEAILKS